MKKNIKSDIQKFLEIDWLEKPYVFILTSLFISTRIPFINLGFGYEADAWRIANSAYDLRWLHVYRTSRFPGYPLPEYVYSLLINHGWLATNSVTMTLSLISVICFAKILNYLNIRRKGLLLLTYVFLPILWINSTNTMDYMWALTFIVIAWFLTLKKRYIFAGLAMGLAIGSRITSFILLPSFIYLILILSKNKISDSFIFSISAITISSILFFPLFAQHGLGFLTYYPTYFPSRIDYVITIGNQIAQFGEIAVVFTLVSLLLSFKTIVRQIAEDKILIFLALAIVPVIILFIKTPYEAEYLIPTIPFGLILFDKVCGNLTIILCILLLLNNSFVHFCDIEIKDGSLLVVPCGKGMLQERLEGRNEKMELARKLLDINVSHSVIICVGDYIQALCFYGRKFDKNFYIEYCKTPGDQSIKWIKDPKRDVRWWYTQPIPEELQNLHKEGYMIYILDKEDGRLRKLF